MSYTIIVITIVQYTLGFFDASKAFDKVNHWNLFKKLIYRGVPIILIRILLFWYRNQTFCVKWGSCTSMFFTVGNGVRQGSILSPHLFAVYVDDLSVNLIDSGQGCCIDNVCINHLFMPIIYALWPLVPQLYRD